MKFEFVAKHLGQYPVIWMCCRLNVSRGGFYEWKRRKPSERSKENERLALQIKVYFRRSDGTYGSPRIRDDFMDDGKRVGRNRIARLMRQQGLFARFPKRFKKTTDSKHNFAVAENIVNQQFHVDERDKVWVADLSYIRTWAGWLYLAVILDLYSRRVVGYAMADHMRAELPLEALKMAVTQRKPKPGLIHHSDRGSQYASNAYQKALSEIRAICSMSGRGNCFDNAVAESFFSTLKQELVYRHAWPTRRHASDAIRRYIENFYNCRRRHSTLGNISPLEYELKNMRVQLAA